MGKVEKAALRRRYAGLFEQREGGVEVRAPIRLKAIFSREERRSPRRPAVHEVPSRARLELVVHFLDAKVRGGVSS